MSPQEPVHAVTDVVEEPGRLSFTARVGDAGSEVWFSADDGPTSAQAVLPSSLLPAMSIGGALELPVSISPRAMRGQVEFQALFEIWSRGWEHGPPLRRVDVLAPTEEPPPGGGRVAAFFSAGVDSWSTLIEHEEEITDLVFMRGFDLLLDNEDQTELAPLVEERVREVADGLGKSLHVVETNLRRFADPLAPWEANFVTAMTAVAHFLAPRFERVYMASGLDYEVQGRVSFPSLAAELWSTEALQVVEDGGRFRRIERVARAAAHPLARRTLRVCWENPGGAYNCGRCRKCVLTMVALEALGVRDRVETFPDELPLENVATFDFSHHTSISLWEDNLDAAREAGRSDLEAVIEPKLREGKAQLGLPPDHRVRSLPGPPSRRPAADGPAQRHGAATLEQVLGSRSWRLTAPLRRAGAWARGLRR
jgi:hypothetical protein